MALIQSKEGVKTADSIDHTVVFDAAPTAGNLLLAYISHRNTSTFGDITLPGWNTGLTATVNGYVTRGFYKIAGASESATVTIDTNGIAAAGYMAIAEFSNIDNTTPINVVATEQDSGTSDVTSLLSGSATTTQAATLLVTFAGVRAGGDNGSYAWTNSFTKIQDGLSTGTSPSGGGLAYREVTATGTYDTTVSYTTAGRVGVLLAAFNMTAATASITGSPSTIVDGGTGYSITTANMGDATSISLRSKQNNSHSIDLSFTGSGGSYTVAAPIVNTNTSSTGIAGVPFTSTYDTLEFVVTDGTDTAVADVTFNPATGYAQVKTGNSPSVSAGSVAENFNGFYEDISAVSVANPTVLSITGHGFTNGQEITVSGLTTSADANGENVFTLVDANSGTIPVNVTSVTDGVGKALTGVANEHGQVMYPTANSTAVGADMILTTDATSNFYVQYFDYVDSKWKAVEIVVANSSSSAVISTNWQFSNW